MKTLKIFTIGILAGLSSMSFAQQAERLTTIVSAFNTESLNATPGAKEDGTFSINLSLSIVPDFDKTVGNKPEEGGDAPAIPKPTLRYDYFGAFAEIGGNPEFSAFDARVSNFSFKAGYGYTDELYGLFTVWGSYNKGLVKANISSNDTSILDELDYDSSTINFTYGYRLFEQFVPYVSFGYGSLNSSLLTVQDDALVTAEFTGKLFSAGLSYTPSKNWAFNAEVNVVDGIITNPRIGLNVLF